MASNTKASTGYRFVDKDPIIDAIRFAIKETGMKSSEIALLANVSKTTLYNYDYGKVRKPQHATARSVLNACGFEELWVSKTHRVRINYGHERGAPSFSVVKIKAET